MDYNNLINFDHKFDLINIDRKEEMALFREISI
jgi:hypothetical protein